MVSALLIGVPAVVQVCGSFKEPKKRIRSYRKSLPENPHAETLLQDCCQIRGTSCHVFTFAMIIISTATVAMVVWCEVAVIARI